MSERAQRPHQPTDPRASSGQLEELLREVVQTLAPLDRTPCSPGERTAAEWLERRLWTIPGVHVALEEAPSWGTFPPTSAALGLLGLAGAVLVRAGRPRAGLPLAACSFAGIVDEAQNGPRVVRRLMRRRRSTVNVIARVGGSPLRRRGERTPPEDGGVAEGAWAAERDAGMDLRGPARRYGIDTLVVLAHHDAPQSGIIFDQSVQRRLHELAPGFVERQRTSPPQWWIGLAGPLATIASAALRRPRLARAGVALGALGVALVADVWRTSTVAGANDNLSGVAALVGLAELLRERPLPGLRVLLVSCGAEETLQDGVRAFITRHRGELPAGRTCFINLDTVGSPHLAMLEAEGPVWMEPYAGPWLRELLADCARRLGTPLLRGFRARSSTDSVIPSRAGYSTATLVSLTDWRVPANYHLPSDVPGNLDYGTVADAARLVHEVARELAGARAAAPHEP
jgi:hypothetical protein